MIENTRQREGALYVDVEVGMPLTGTANLAETPLLMLLGDFRWRQIQTLCGMPSRDLVDEQGQRVYATFYYIGVHFPPDTSMATFGENDRFTIVNTLRLHDGASLDGFHLLYPIDWPEERKLPLQDEAEIRRLGIPFVRSSNIFVRMVEGASWLKKSAPVALPAEAGGARPGLPDTYSELLRVSQESGFEKPPSSHSRLTPGKVSASYRPEPDRDLNGVGLLYFANYSKILDVVERQVLSSDTAVIPLGDDLMSRRSLVRRETAYLCNIAPSDSIQVEIEAWIENPFLLPEKRRSNTIRIFTNAEMHRCSDGRKMLVSTAAKVIHRRGLAEEGLLGPLERLAGHDPSPWAPVS